LLKHQMLSPSHINLHQFNSIYNSDRVSQAPVRISTFMEPNRMKPDARFGSSNVPCLCLNTLFQSLHPFVKNND
jgi:hypothetical protein